MQMETGIDSGANVKRCFFKDLYANYKKRGLARVIGLHLAAQIARQGRADGKQGRGGGRLNNN